jgi:hypothetical protein
VCADTRIQIAGVTRTRQTIVAIHQFALATQQFVAEINGAGVAVITYNGRLITDLLDADVRAGARCARIAIITVLIQAAGAINFTRLDLGIETTKSRVTQVFRTRLFVVTFDGLIKRGVLAANSWVATIHGAGITVIAALERVLAEAGTLVTVVIRTGIAIVAVLRIENATISGQAAIECAGVVVVAENLLVTAGEGHRVAQILGAGVVIVTGVHMIAA